LLQDLFLTIRDKSLQLADSLAPGRDHRNITTIEEATGTHAVKKERQIAAKAIVKTCLAKRGLRQERRGQ
jgi:hypothetical protein